MKTNLLKNTMLTTMITAALAGCGGNEGGLDYNFKSDHQVQFNDEPVAISINEMSGILALDLLQGATINDQPIDPNNTTVFLRDFRFTPLNPNFVTPQQVVHVPSQPASPFFVSEDKTQLIVATDAFDQALRMCDETDETGDKDEDGNDIGNGVRDYPQSITYSVSFVIDNGYELQPGVAHPRRTLILTINAISDPVTEVQAFDVDVAVGDAKPMLSATLPTYACNNNLTYAIADNAIAEVDEAGNISGKNIGETEITVTSEENAELFQTATVTVTPGFNLAIANQDFNDLGAPLGTKTVPACIHTGLEVQPSIVNDELTGDYTYDWTSDNANSAFAMSESNGMSGEFGRFANNLAVGESANLTVNFGSGYTGSTQAEDVIEQTVAITAAKNLSCDPGVSVHPAGFNTDFLIDQAGAPYKESWVTKAPTQLSGSAIQLMSQGDEKTVAHQEVWNKQRNWYSANYGLGTASIAKQYQYKVWAKLNQVPASEAKLTIANIAWKYDGGPTGPGFDLRRPGAGILSATLKPTTDWQLVEFIDEESKTQTWSVPAHWNLVTDVFQFWEVTGLAAGESIILDEASIVEVE